MHGWDESDHAPSTSDGALVDRVIPYLVVFNALALPQSIDQQQHKKPSKRTLIALDLAKTHLRLIAPP